MTVKQLIAVEYEYFIDLFQTTFSNQQNSNEEFLKIVSNLFFKQKWNQLITAFQKAVISSNLKIVQQINILSSTNTTTTTTNNNNTNTTANNNTTMAQYIELQQQWKLFDTKIQKLKLNLPRITHGFAFASIDGLLIQAMKNGDWLLLDEINLASSETLQSLTNLLEDYSQNLDFEINNNNNNNNTSSSSSSSTTTTTNTNNNTNTTNNSNKKSSGKNVNISHITGNNTEGIKRHPNFRIFAAMNPPTDVGKRELPANLRSRFTEIYTPEMLSSTDLEHVVSQYMSDIISTPIADIVKVYLHIILCLIT